MATELSARERIINAYLVFLKEKDYNRIKVSELISAANVNRSTFYRNFEDVYSLYSAICNDLKEEMEKEIHAIFDPSDMRKSAIRSVAKVLEHSDKIALLAGRKGNRKFLYDIRNTCFNALKKDTEEAGLWNEDRHYIIGFSADFVVLKLAYIILDDDNEFNDFEDIDYTYDLDADPIDNVVRALNILYGGNHDMHTALFLSALRKFSLGDSRHKTITELFGYSGFSRTEFYKVFKNKEDYFVKFDNLIYLIVIKEILPRLMGDDPNVFIPILDHWEKYYKEIERSAIINGLEDGYMLHLGIKTLWYLHRAYSHKIEKDRGRVLDEREQDELAFFVCSAVCCFVYYIATMDREQYFRQINALYLIKRQMKF